MGKKEKEEKPSGPWEHVAAAIEACRQQVRECERVNEWAIVNGEYVDNEDFDDRADYLKILLRQAHTKMLLLIEKYAFVHFLPEYRKGFEAFDNLAEFRRQSWLGKSAQRG